MPEKIILLTNLGSPDSTLKRDVYRYLNEFLMDERVIDLPYLGRLLLVRGIITPFRTPRSSRKYKKIWTEKGSPLIEHTRQLADKLQDETGLPVYHCMRYGNPAPKAVFDKITQENPEVKEVILFPLYPHYSMSSFETAVEHVRRIWLDGVYKFSLSVVPPFYNKDCYITALAASIERYLKSAEYDHVLFSYHGVPVRHITKRDASGRHCMQKEDCCGGTSPVHAYCYRHQVRETTKLVTERLGLNKEQYSLSFQSRLGTDSWLKPSTDATVRSLPALGRKRLLVVCPSFVSDCLETLEEIDMGARESFMEAGGEHFTCVPCLNTDEAWVKAIAELSLQGETKPAEIYPDFMPRN
jgi:ferrochelatase